MQITSRVDLLIPSLSVKYSCRQDSELYSLLHRFHDVNLFLEYHHVDWNPQENDLDDFFSANTLERIDIFVSQYKKQNVDFFEGNIKDFAWLFYLMYLKSNVSDQEILDFLQKLDPYYMGNFFLNHADMTCSLLEHLDEQNLELVATLSQYHALQVRNHCFKMSKHARICLVACQVLHDFVDWILACDKPYILTYLKGNPEIVSKFNGDDQRFALVFMKLKIPVDLSQIKMNSSMKTCILITLNHLDGLRLFYQNRILSDFDLHICTLFYCQSYKKILTLIAKTTGYDNMVDNDTVQGLHLFFEDLISLEDLKIKLLECLAQKSHLQHSLVVSSIYYMNHFGIKKSVHDCIKNMILNYSNSTQDAHHIIKMISQMTNSEASNMDKSILMLLDDMTIKQKCLSLFYLIKCGFIELEAYLSDLRELIRFLESDPTFTPCFSLLVDQFPHLFVMSRLDPFESNMESISNGYDLDFLSDLSTNTKSTTNQWKRIYADSPILISLKTLNLFKNTSYKTNEVYKNLLLAFQWKIESHHLEIFLTILDHFMIGSRKYISNLVSDPIKASNYSLTQESAVIQLLLELVHRDLDQGLIFDFVHQKFISNPMIARIVHLQTYEISLIPKTVTIESMHICIDFLPEIINHPNKEKRIFGFVLLSHLLIKYPTTRYMDLAQYVLCRREFEVDTPEWIESFVLYQKYYPFECLKYLDEIKVSLSSEMNVKMIKVISQMSSIYN